MNVGQMFAHRISSAGNDAANDTLVSDVLMGFEVNAHIVRVRQHLGADRARRGNGFLPTARNSFTQQFIKYRMTT